MRAERSVSTDDDRGVLRILGGDGDVGIVLRDAIDRRISGRDGMAIEFASNDADATRRLDSDGDAVAVDSIDCQHDIVTDEELFAFFST